MPTIEELLNSRDQSLSSFSPSSNEEDSLIDESSLTPEEMTAAAALGVNTKRLSQKAYRDLKAKAEGIVKSSSIKPEKTTGELVKEIAKGGGKKSAEASAKQFVKAQPSLGFPTKDVAEAVGDAIPSGVANEVEKTALERSPILSRLAGLASSPAAKTALKGMGLAALIPGLYGDDLSEDQDTPQNRQLTASEMMNTLSGKPVNYQPPGDRSEMNPIMASSMYDSPQQIVADLARAKEEPARQLAAPDAPSEALKPAPRMVSAGEPSAAQVQKQEQDAALAEILKSQGAEQSRYVELLNKFKEAQERQQQARRDIGLAQAAELIGSSIAMVKPEDQSFYQQLNKQADEITERFKEEASVAREAEKNDPNSTESRSMRALLKQQGITVPENISAAFIEKQYPQFANIINRREAAQARKDELKLRFAEIAARKDETRSEKQDRFIQALRKETTSGALGKMFSNYSTARRMSSALDEFSKNPTGYSDYATLMGGLKALQGDESVVRESEIRLGMNATSLANKVKNWSDRLISGKGLQKEQREEMVKAVKILADTARGQYTDAIAPIMAQADDVGIDKKMLVSQGFLEPSKMLQSEDKIIVEKDGKRFKLPKSQLQRAVSQGYKEVQ